MNTNNLIQCVFYLAAMLAVTKPLGWYIAKVYEGEAPWLRRVFGGFENLLYRICGVDSKEEMNWKTYAKAVMVFSTVSVLALYFLQRIQHLLPLNPMAMAPVAPDLAWNTAMSFHHQYRLAGLRRRNDHELFNADVRHGRSRISSRPQLEWR